MNNNNNNNKNTEDVYKFSEHALNFNGHLPFCTFSIQIHVVNFDPKANLTHTYEEKNTYCTFGLLDDIIIKYEGRKTHTRDKLYVRGGDKGL